MRGISKAWIPFAIAAVFAACTAEVEDAGAPPDVDVSGGRAPDVDVEPADINISTDTQTVEVPDIDVETRDP